MNEIDIQLPGLAFDADFQAGLPRLEQKMRLRGLEPADFLLTKGLASYQPYPGISVIGVSYNYQVNVAGEKFEVTFPTDMKFFDYFEAICFAPEGAEKVSIFERLRNWLATDL